MQSKLNGSEPLERDVPVFVTSYRAAITRNASARKGTYLERARANRYPLALVAPGRTRALQ